MTRAFLPQLTGLRGAAALWVVSFHASPNVEAGQWAPFQMGYLGVDVFFVLSGFILGHVHIDDFVTINAVKVGRFLVLRISRIYPVHFVMLIASAMFAGLLLLEGVQVLANPRYDPALFLPNLLLIHAWGWVDHASFNGLSWSISAEWMAYLAFPLLAFVANRLSSTMALLVAISAIAGELLAFSAFGAPNIFDVARLAPIRMGGEFVCGLCLYVVHRRGSLSALPWTLITNAMLAGFMIAILWRASFAAILCIPFFIMGMAQGRGVVAKFLSSPTMLYLGEVSYSLYMVHLITLEIAFAPLNYTRLVTAGLFLRITFLAGSLGLIAICTVVMHRCIEVPARLWLRAKLDIGSWSNGPDDAPRALG